MPYFQTMANRASKVFSFDEIDEIDVERIAGFQTLCEVMEFLGIARNALDNRVVDTIPMGIQVPILSVVRYALEGRAPNERMQITFSWAPAYDWSVKIWEAHAIEGSPAAMTVMLEGPYPEP